MSETTFHEATFERVETYGGVRDTIRNGEENGWERRLPLTRSRKQKSAWCIKHGVSFS